MIVDASVAFKWIAPEDDSDLASDLILKHELFAPNFLLIEVANGLWKKAIRHQLDPEVSFAPELDRLDSLVNLLDETTIVGRALEIGRNIPHSIYDCLYLAMAEAREEVVVTADAKLVGKLHGGPFANLILPLSEAVAL